MFWGIRIEGWGEDNMNERTLSITLCPDWRKLTLLLLSLFVLVGCDKGPDIQGTWYFDYEKTRFSEFPNAQYESARMLIADVEPRYGSINVEGDTVVLGGSVCKIQKVNDVNGLKCDEHGMVNQLSLFLEEGRLIVKTHGDNPVTAVFSRTKQDPFLIYGVDPNAKEVIEDTAPREKVAEPLADAGAGKLIGYARTQSFNAFYQPESIKTEGRLTTVTVVLNYLEPLGEAGAQPVLSSVQTITFDCPGSNYRLDRYVQYSELNGKGAVVADSGAYAEYKSEMRPVPQNSVNEVLYMRICR